MSTRIPLQINEGRLVLKSLVECPKIRVPKHFMDFVVDTGSQNSFLSSKDASKMQIPLKNRPIQGEIDFGGSRYNQVLLPKFKMYLLKEDNTKKDYITLQVSLTALKTTKTSEKKMQVAYMLPSILGMDFLKNQKLSLYLNLTENIAYLQFE